MQKSISNNINNYNNYFGQIGTSKKRIIMTFLLKRDNNYKDNRREKEKIYHIGKIAN